MLFTSIVTSKLHTCWLNNRIFNHACAWWNKPTSTPRLVISWLRHSMSFASQMPVFSRFRSGMQAFLTPRATTVARLSFWSSPHPISSSQLHTLLCFHPCPINLVVFKGVYSFRMGYLISRGASRLDAFSVYPFRTWLPGRRLGSLTGTPAVRPSRSSRTKDSSSQISYAHAG